MKQIYFCQLALVLLLIGCKSQVIVNSDIEFDPIKAVSLKEYQSVQERDTTQQNPKLALGVSIAGGGSRAQYFGLGVLMGLEEIKDSFQRNFLNDVDYFSTVSGGGFAAGYYFSVRKNVLQKDNSIQSLRKFWLSEYRIDTLQAIVS